MNRGARRQPVFLNDADRRSFGSLLGEIFDRFAIETHAYALMGNHYHLLLHAPQGQLDRAMQHLGAVHTIRFNQAHGVDGALFRGRYRSLLVADDAYLLQASRYIHLNPLEAGLADHPSRYRWSSCGAYYGTRTAPRWLHTGMILSMMGHRPREQYAALIESDDAPLAPSFRKRSERADSPNPRTAQPSAVGPTSIPLADVAPSPVRRTGVQPAAIPLGVDGALGAMDEAAANAFGFSASRLYENRRGVENPARALAILLAHEAGATLAEVAARYGFATTSGAGNAVTRTRRKVDEDPEMRAVYDQLRTSGSDHDGSGL